MPGAEWLELLCRHIPDRYEHVVRYVGWYSVVSQLEHRARGQVRSNNVFERTVKHRGRTVLAMDCALAGAEERWWRAAQLDR